MADEKSTNETTDDEPKTKSEESTKSRLAAEAVRCAEAELEKAREFYNKVQQEATERIKSAREKTVGDLIDGTLETVKKYPAVGLGAAALLGICIGRIFKR